MRVAITGASGNSGTALLRALVHEPTVTSLVGVASRVPRNDGSSTVAYPHDRAQWVRCDIGSPDASETLREAFNHADVVVHLAWARTPHRDADRLDAVNVHGTSRVLEAAAAVGVQHVVVASSAGVYAPAPDAVPRDEEWARTGVPGALHSIQKVHVERLLDAFERTHPDITVTRVRPALVLQEDAASELAREFLGPLVPPKVLHRDHPPRLFWPAGLRVQAVHADDLAAAYRAIVAGRHPGAFNVAGREVLGPDDVAAAVDAPGVKIVSPAWARRLLVAGWRTHATHLSPDWLDLALALPVLDVRRATTTLRWEPRHPTADVLGQVSRGIGRGAGFPSPPLVPRKI
ncbi:NAD-dependent epimerase/dehydratase family protein [Luteimicrobium subarcticum]|uniref:Nucleoside-diphosphate-sugar epimerase n=1 Tax=Luteimicrobium subarcticum TaxID=620910 RepID=A0A2M8WSJ0_9MICO|nr:NAD-dependent epimerase/dehydratase family protein [Luteimicrobium subarcticum]PJI93915.1 nucleoside-diphosphate-sugar epimerase [Luteimicrobium subarcticum]